jgi:hypothetical protein
MGMELTLVWFKLALQVGKYVCIMYVASGV